jgi:prolyl oligopeptidase
MHTIFHIVRRIVTASFLLPILVHCQPLPPVPARLQPVTNAYHGVIVTDPYQWLEEPGAGPVLEWTRLQNERTRSYFSRLPYREGIAQQLMQLRSEESARYFGLDWKKGRIFALRFKPPTQQPILVRLSSLDPPALWKTVFDPNTYNTNGSTAIDWSVVSLDGKLIALSLSEGGSEDGTLHFVEVDSGKELADKIPRVQYPTAGGSAAWNADGSGVYYTRYPNPGERPEADLHFCQQIWFHKLGTPSSEDHYELGKDFPRIAEIAMQTSEDGQWLLATVANGDGGDFAHYLRSAAGKWQQITRFEDGVKSATIGRDGSLYLVTVKDAPRGKVLRLPLTTPDLAKATLAVPALYAYSPLHHVRDHEKYPAVLLTTGENDGRVNPYQSRKMAARLQAATGSERPILFRSTAGAGHGIGTSLKERIAEQADVYSFLFNQLGMDAVKWDF